jgi:hypothetical protein
MKKSVGLLKSGFESSSSLTPEFAQFYRTFKSEFTKELKNAGAENIVFSRMHFCLSGFCTVNGQVWYFSLSDVRGMEYNHDNIQLMYRTANHYKDYKGGMNQWVKIGTGMFERMF